jgi:Holliday junction resolvase RusA-like endonuclease
MIIKTKQGRMIAIPSQAYTKWEKASRKAILYQLAGHVPAWVWTEKLHVKVTAYYKGAKPDLSGVLESVGDCCESILWSNDANIESWDGSRLHHDLTNPRTVVEVMPYEPSRLS